MYAVGELDQVAQVAHLVLLGEHLGASGQAREGQRGAADATQRGGGDVLLDDHPYVVALATGKLHSRLAHAHLLQRLLCLDRGLGVVVVEVQHQQVRLVFHVHVRSDGQLVVEVRLENPVRQRLPHGVPRAVLVLHGVRIGVPDQRA
jgi:hypothetical protein